jgi:hypothetical protein
MTMMHILSRRVEMRPTHSLPRGVWIVDGRLAFVKKKKRKKSEPHGRWRAARGTSEHGPGASRIVVGLGNVPANPLRKDRVPEQLFRGAAVDHGAIVEERGVDSYG